MEQRIYTIGFTKKSAEQFFGLLNDHSVGLLVDVRLNNKSQLAGFSKYPDIEFFLREICDIEYVHDLVFAPTDTILQDYKSKKISWGDYEKVYASVMEERKADMHIIERYSDKLQRNICLLCSEETPEHCHRRLVAERFSKLLGLKEVDL